MIQQQPQYFPPQQYQIQPSEPKLPTPVKLPSRPSTANRSPPLPPQISSPVRAEGDAGQLRRAYLQWQIQRNPSEEAAFVEALDKLDEDGCSLKQMRSMPMAEWKEIGIRRGIAFRLKDEVKNFLELLRINSAATAAAVDRRHRTSLDDLAESAALEDLNEDSSE